MPSSPRTAQKQMGKNQFAYAPANLPDIAEAEAVLLELARVFADSDLNPVLDQFTVHSHENGQEPAADAPVPNLEDKYRAFC